MIARFIDHLYAQLVTTRNYNVIANPHTLQIIRAHAKSSQSFTSRFLVTDLNRDSSGSALTSLLSSEYPTTELTLTKLTLLITSHHGPSLKPRLICASIPYSGNVFTEPLPRNMPGITAHLAVIT
jgi:hypothetical protein